MRLNNFGSAVRNTWGTLAVFVALLAIVPCRGQQYTNLFAFGGAAGAHPAAGLIFDAAGHLFGTTYRGGDMTACGGYGCGTVFLLSPNSDGTWSEIVLYAFEGGSDGSIPLDRLAIDVAGNLYGTTETGGDSSCGCGVVFKLDPEGQFTVLHTFTGDDGILPFAGLTLDGAGNLYGTTFEGGSSGYGTVFKLSPTEGTWTYSLLFDFSDWTIGAYPTRGALVLDANGNLYGTTENGGTFGYGTVYKLERGGNGTWKQQVIHHFKGTGAAYPQSALLLDSDGSLYGTTSGGGYGSGTVFRLSPNANGSWTFSILYAFQGTGDGADPMGGVMRDARGHLFGTTYAGGMGVGTVYRLTATPKGPWKESIIYVFGAGLGCQPLGELIPDAHGNLYGTGSYCSDGTVFEIIR